MFRIEPVERYRVFYRYRGKRRYADFNTPIKAVERAAWWMIYDKYGAEFDDDAPKRFIAPAWMACECADDHPRDSWGQQAGFDWYDCRVHDRDNGYFRRLHDRLVRYITTKGQASIEQSSPNAWRDDIRRQGEQMRRSDLEDLL